MMPVIRPFHGVRYDMAQVGALSDVVAPPYDVIDRGLQDRLYQASPYNVIRLGLNREEPGDGGGSRTGTPARRGCPQGTGSATGVLRARCHPRGFISTSRPTRSRAAPYLRAGFLARGWARAVRPGEDLPARADALGPKGRPACGILRRLRGTT